MQSLNQNIMRRKTGLYNSNSQHGDSIAYDRVLQVFDSQEMSIICMLTDTPQAVYLSLDELQTDLDIWLNEYDMDRTHPGRCATPERPYKLCLTAGPSGGKKSDSSMHRTTDHQNGVDYQIRSEPLHIISQREYSA